MGNHECTPEESTFFGTNEQIVKELRRWSVGRSKKFEKLGIVDDRDGASILAAAAATISRLSMTLDGRPTATEHNKQREEGPPVQTALFHKNNALEQYRKLYDMVSDFVEEGHAEEALSKGEYSALVVLLESCQNADREENTCPHCHKTLA